MAHNDRVSGSSDDDFVRPGERNPVNRQWLLAAAGGFVVLAIIVVAGAASIWDSEPSLDDRPTGDPPPREYGGPLWFTVGAADQTQLITNTIPRAVVGPGQAVTAVARYLPIQKCFTDGSHVLVWPRGSRPITGDRAGVSPADGVQILDGDTFRATGEEIVIADADQFPETEGQCAPSGKALSLSDAKVN